MNMTALKEETATYRKLLFSFGVSTTIKPTGEGMQFRGPAEGDDSNAGHANGWMVLLVKMSAAWRDIEVLIDNEHIDCSV